MKAYLPDNRLNFSAKADLRRELITNMSNLKKGSCHRSYTLWRKGLNGLSFDSQSLERGSIKRERKDGLLMLVSIPIFTFFLWFSFQSFFLLSHFSMNSFFIFLFFFYLPLLPPYFSWLSPPPFYTIYHCGIYHFCPSTAFSSLWVSLQAYPLACLLPSHYLYLECVGCTTLYSQKNLLILFLAFLYFCFTLLDKD